ncbi:arginine--tRNA ligase [Bifidobacterium sp. W8108]|uniref:arginine--tRNA ligase n=1 Tax=unclassified Bifidobacterium TaxID=2608897 RepID=UPI0018DD7631|nr:MULTISPECIES: arginine--tRNA ligase [unclassified Bifidobacterium]MBH9978286.1 arginine--tRNA ligase [Bifidobacterium sp. W8108]MBI0173844.1 arginine--tRNA ligase [Bifidobacterium sp. M0307]MCT6878529.1 arginine--tRNA ligase [Bifidobacteriales bacterium]
MSPEALARIISSTAVELAQAGRLGDLDASMVPAAENLAVMRPKDRSHGDWSTNIAMQLAKKAGMNPRDMGQTLAEALAQADGISGVDVAGPGFINISLDSASAAAVVDTVLSEGRSYGANNHLQGRTLNLEFVSANPTGPIHIGGTRWAAVGDSMARVLEANGAKVVREYYFNDHGTQIDRFARSLVAAAHHEPVPADGYKGAYIDEIAQRVVDQAKAEGLDVLALPRVRDEDGAEGDSEQREAFRSRAVPMMFDEIRRSMQDFRVDFDVWFHENSLYESGQVQEAIEELRTRDDIYEKDGATWFRSSRYGDDKDRVVVKSDGNAAYVAADIAYYLNKRRREKDPCDEAIYMLGADHHGYIGRMMAICAAFGDTPGVNMQILIGQLVNVLKDGQTVRMSKRAGNVVTIDDLVEAVGVDAARYSLARTDYNQTVDIDLDLLASHTNENPVYYVQYAHARSKNVDRNAADAGIESAKADLSLLDTEADNEVLATLALYPNVVQTAGDQKAPHRVAHYLEQLAGVYHRWYNLERVVPMELTGADDPARQTDKNPEPARAAARLRLNDAVQQVIANGLDLLGVCAPDRM